MQCETMRAVAGIAQAATATFAMLKQGHHCLTQPGRASVRHLPLGAGSGRKPMASSAGAIWGVQFAMKSPNRVAEWLGIFRENHGRVV
jgi:hypothetical protein